MIYALLGVGALFIAIGFSLTENNAPYLLSGYNTMSKEDQKAFDLKGYLNYFRKFHFILGGSYIVIGVLLHFLISSNIAGAFIGIYPILAYIYFISSSKRFSKSIGEKGASTKLKAVAQGILVACLLFVITLLIFGFKEDKLVVDSTGLAFKGFYSERIEAKQIAKVELVYDIPAIVMKTNGFALGTINKGYFKTSSGEVVKLILNTNQQPYLLITKKDGGKIYYSTTEDAIEKIYNDITNKLSL